METGANRLRDELKRQMSQANLDGPRVDGIITVRDQGAGYLAALRSLDLQVAEFSRVSEEFNFAGFLLHDQSLLWKILGFCAPYSYFLDPDFMRKKMKDIHSISSDPIRTYIDNIWQHPQLLSWARADTSSLLLVQGNYDWVPRLDLFSADLAEHIERQHPLAFVSCAAVEKIGYGIPLPLTATQMLRNVAIQALRSIARPVSVSLLIELAIHFCRATTCRDWFDLLEKVLLDLSSLYIIINIGTLLDTELQDWPNQFEMLLKNIRKKSSSTIARVIILSCRSFGHFESSNNTAIIWAGRLNSHPDQIRSLPRHRIVIPRGLWRLPGGKNAGQNDGYETFVESGSETTCDGGVGCRTVTSAPFTMDKGNVKPKDRREFEVAIFCALPREADAVEALFDRRWDRREYGKAQGDANSYTVGAIRNHNVVLVHLPGIGKSIAASVASSCRTSFTGIKLALVVGVCAGVPFGVDRTERVLGDVAISNGLIQYDFGRQLPGQFVRKSNVQDSLSRPNAEIRAFLARLEGRQSRKLLLNGMQGHLEALQTCLDSEEETTYEYPGIDADILYKPSYLHKHHDATLCPSWAQDCGVNSACNSAQGLNCDELNCDDGQLISRQRLTRPTTRQFQDYYQSNTVATELKVHIGTIGSGDKVMKSAGERDSIARDENIIAFEMEGAGVWEHFSCLIIKGICDYADCHKGKKWQNYAAATAAACMKAVLEQWD